jgi:hypothetical protein
VLVNFYALGGDGMASINYERNRKYFTPVRYKPGIICIVAGVLLLFSGSAAPVMIGLVLIALGGFLIYNQVGDRPTDEDLDRQVKEILGGLNRQALEKLCLDAEEVSLIPPIVVGGNSFGGSQVKRGKDGVVRTSACEGIVIFFGEQELHSYKFEVSLIADNRISEETDVYFYRDVVSVSTKSDNIQVQVEGKSVQVQLELFRLTTSGGTTIQCSMGATSANTKGRDIQGAKALIRNKKMLAT